ncbi:helix-turn-helix domain-containing protein [Chitinophaga agrisoli]|uniref:Helix-turn-helix domain-containing protein n=1 Tax=Chitinophaga agrisoli TaxID=2607653 RepID=A0A5B2VVU1_9BACT|nr:AraC family transcriptional regulator [Chitinophaga agrisoli]KAA2242472.1 helix-turn-helix domain-containing protein [Chitinophaga agrisoli]
MSKEHTVIPTYPIQPSAATQFMIREIKSPRDEEKREWVKTPHRHDFYAITIVEKGYGKHLVDFREYTITPNSLHIMVPYQVHHVHQEQDTEQEVRAMLLFFARDLILAHPLLDELEWMDKQLSLSGDETTLLTNICRQLLAEYEQPQPMGQRIIQHYLDILLSHISRIASSRSPARDLTNDARLVRKLQTLIGQHFVEEKSAAAYAGMLHLTPGYLGDVVKQQTGKPTSQLIADRIILEAKRLLVHTSSSVKEVAYRLNFNESTYFYRFFKKHTGETPEQFREMIRERYRTT